MTWLRSFALAAVAAATLGAETIHLKTRDLEPEPDRYAYLSQPLKRRVAGSSHYVLQFTGPVTAERFGELRKRGITVTSYLPNSAVVIAAPDDFSVDGLPVRWVGRLEWPDKISPLIAKAGHIRKPQTYIIEFHADVAIEEARAIVREHGLGIIENPDLNPHHLLVTAWPGDLSRLASWDEVAYIFPASHELTAHERVYPCAGAVVQQAAVAQFATVGPGWPYSSTNGLVLGYVFSHLTAKLPSSTSQSEIRRAFNEWAKYIMLNWVQGTDSQAPQTVNILFAQGAHGDAYPFDSSGKVLAHTFYPAPPNPESIAGDLHLNDDERWQVGANIDLYSVVLHETGHALGLGHSDQPGDVMYPYYRLQTHLSDRDIETVRSLYPARDPSATNQATSPSHPTQPSPPSPPPAAAPLALTVTAPAAVSTTTASTVAISGTTTGGTGAVRVTWSTDGGFIGTAFGSATWLISAAPLSVGANSITITASDSAGHLATQQISVTRQQPAPSSPSPAPPSPPNPAPPTSPSPQPPGSPGDTTPPSLLVTYPASTIFSTTGSTITLKGLATDNVSVTSVTWSSSTGTSGVATGTTLWAAKDLPLVVGNNVITVKAFDAAGNYAWRAIIIVRQ